MKMNRTTLVLFLLASVFFLLPYFAKAATLEISPQSGEFPVGSTFTAKVYINTEGEEINALDVSIDFPADKIQLVSPNTSLSVVDVWASQPKFNNNTGSISFQGGIPNGLSTSRGLISELTFRVKSTGRAAIIFDSSSNVYLNDGEATPASTNFQNSLLTLTLPPPAGPIVSTSQHRQGVWSKDNNIFFEWSGEYEGYSLVLDRSPVTVPDNVVDTTDNSIAYRDLVDGVHFFHIKALRGGVWGGVTHYEVNIDATSPALFDIEFLPSARTSALRPTISFLTSDRNSGINFYEISIIPLSGRVADGSQYGFIEATSPYIPERLEPGSYDVIVRAYDKAGNVTEVKQKLRIVQGFISLISREGVVIRDVATVPWFVLWILLLLLVAAIAREIYIARKLERVYQEHKKDKEDPKKVSEALKELKAYQKKYGHLVIFFAITVSVLTFFDFNSAHAQEMDSSQMATPIITSWSETVTNDEIFYVRGYSSRAAEATVLYLQDRNTGSVQTFEIDISEGGDWFYRHGTFLRPGDYGIWVQARFGDELSAPSSERIVRVSKEALSFGLSRLSLGAVYLIITVLLILLLFFFAWYATRIKRKARLGYERYLEEIKEAEESVRRGFAILRRDLHRELKSLRAQIENHTITPEELMEKEQLLLDDLRHIEQKIGKEVWDIEIEAEKNK